MLTTIIIDLAHKLNPPLGPLQRKTISRPPSISQREALSSIIITDCTRGCQYAKEHKIPCIGLLTSLNKNENLSCANILYEKWNDIDDQLLIAEYNRYHMLPVDILSTQRLHLRELSVDDIKKLYQLYQNPINTQYIPTMASLKEEEEKHLAYITHVYHFYRFGLWGVFLKDTNTLIGRCGLQCIEVDGTPLIELAYLIDQAYTNQGYAYEVCTHILNYAKEELVLPTLYALIDKENIPSLHLIKKLGFSLEKEVYHQDANCYQYRIDF